MDYMGMTDPTNPRKVYETGGSTVISLPRAFREQCGIDLGDRFVLEETDHGFQAVKVEFRVASDV